MVFSGEKNHIHKPGCGREALWAAGALLLCLLLCYVNSFNASWQYDDFSNIVNNPYVRMTEVSWSKIAQAVNAGLDYQLVSRPLAFLSFAINYRFGQTDVFGYHVVNFIIHWMTGFCLFLFVRDTLRLPIFNGRYKKNAAVMAWLAAVLWAVHPIQVTAVTYIVQRMASLAGLFYIASMLLYLIGRRSGSRYRYVAYTMCAVAALCAMLTKENAVLLAPSILLYDVMLLQGGRKINTRRNLLLAMGAMVGIVLVGLLYVDPSTLFEPYDNRPFTKLERLLTQSRVLFLYLSLLIVPMISRMTILHDVTISHSVIEPWTTLLAIVGWGAVLLLCVKLVRRNPLISYCILFYLLNHSIEASVFNLELAYEHRNYIPTMLLFVPIAMAVNHGLALFHYNRALRGAVWMAVVCIIASFGYTTHAYNKVFQSELSLWHHAVDRAPALSLTHNNLGNVYWSMGLREQAHAEFQLADQLNRYFNFPHKGLVYHNLGLYLAYEQRNYTRALDYFKKAKTYHHGNPKIWYQAARMQAALGDYAATTDDLTQALTYWPHNADLHYLKAFVHLRMDRCADAIDASQAALTIDSDHKDALAVLAQGYYCQGNPAKAIDYWTYYIEKEPRSLHGLLALVELNGLNGDEGGVKRYLNRLYALGKGRSLQQILALAKREKALSPYVPDEARINDAAVRLNGERP